MGAVVARVLIAATLACVAAPSALAHGDPGSEYLEGHQVYLPFDLKASFAKEQQLVALVAEANRAGFSIRVVLVWSRYDLGSRNVFWKRPQQYARYLEEDLRGVYKERLLVLMPGGFGFSRLGRSTSDERTSLSKIPIGPGPTGLVDASLRAVRTLAGESGVKLSGTAAAHPSSRNRDRAIIAIAAVALLSLLSLALRRRR
jgi:hypothetical protein